ncbi:MAG TPA: hypothetical protein VK550_12380 [Polyangiaceae bacterium]|nr:hypothetical protein [Polyangiaceae bacterium]
MGRLLMLVAALGLVMCNLPPPTPPTPVGGSDASPGPTPGPDADPPAPPALDAAPGPSDACRRSYDHLLLIHCTPQQPTVGTWVDVCRNGRQHGAFRLDGIDRATTPDEARRAGVNCTSAP